MRLVAVELMFLGVGGMNFLKGVAAPGTVDLKMLELLESVWVARGEAADEHFFSLAIMLPRLVRFVVLFIPLLFTTDPTGVAG